MISETPSWSISSLAIWLVFAGSNWLSRATTSICWPRTPPCALSSSTAMVTPSRMFRPTDAAVPEKGATSPMRTAPCSAVP